MISLEDWGCPVGKAQREEEETSLILETYIQRPAPWCPVFLARRKQRLSRQASVRAPISENKRMVPEVDICSRGLCIRRYAHKPTHAHKNQEGRCEGGREKEGKKEPGMRVMMK